MGFGLRLIGVGSWLIAGVFLAFLVQEMDNNIRVLVFSVYLIPVILFYVISIAGMRRRPGW
jgi:hypothetical protein